MRFVNIFSLLALTLLFGSFNIRADPIGSYISEAYANSTQKSRTQQKEFTGTSLNTSGLSVFEFTKSISVPTKSENASHREEKFDVSLDFSAKQTLSVRQDESSGSLNTSELSDFEVTKEEFANTEPVRAFFRGENIYLPTDNDSSQPSKEEQGKFNGSYMNMIRQKVFEAIEGMKSVLELLDVRHWSSNINSQTNLHSAETPNKKDDSTSSSLNTTELTKLEDRMSITDSIHASDRSANINSVADFFSTETERREFQVRDDTSVSVKQGDKPSAASSINLLTDVSAVNTSKLKIEEYVTSNYSIGLKDFQAREVSSNFFETISVFYRTAFINSSTDITSMQTSSELEDMKEENDTSFLVERVDSHQDHASSGLPIDVSSIHMPKVKEIEHVTSNYPTELKEFETRKDISDLFEPVNVFHRAEIINSATNIASVQTSTEVEEDELNLSMNTTELNEFSVIKRNEDNSTIMEQEDMSHHTINANSSTHAVSKEALTVEQSQFANFTATKVNDLEVVNAIPLHTKPKDAPHVTNTKSSTAFPIEQTRRQMQSLSMNIAAQKRFEILKAIFGFTENQEVSYPDSNVTSSSDVTSTRKLAVAQEKSNIPSVNTTRFSELEDMKDIFDPIDTSHHFNNINSVADLFSSNTKLREFEEGVQDAGGINSSVNVSSIKIPSLKLNEYTPSSYSTGLKEFHTEIGISGFIEPLNVFYRAAFINSSANAASVETLTGEEHGEFTSSSMNTTGLNEFPLMKRTIHDSAFLEQVDTTHRTVNVNSAINFSPKEGRLGDSSVREKQAKISYSSGSTTGLIEFPLMSTNSTFTEIEDENYYLTETDLPTNVSSIELIIQNVTTMQAQGEFMGSSTNTTGLSEFPIVNYTSSEQGISDFIEPESVFYRGAIINVSANVTSVQASTKVEKGELTNFSINITELNEFPGTKRKVDNSPFIEQVDSPQSKVDLIFNFTLSETLEGNSTVKERESENTHSSANISALSEFPEMNPTKTENENYHLKKIDSLGNVSSIELQMKNLTASEVQGRSIGSSINISEISEFIVLNSKHAIKKIKDKIYRSAKIGFLSDTASTELPIQISSAIEDKLIVPDNNTTGLSNFSGMNNKSAVKELEDETFLSEKTDIFTDATSTEMPIQSSSTREEQSQSKFIGYSTNTTLQFKGMTNYSALMSKLSALEDTKVVFDPIDVSHLSGSINSVKDLFSTETDLEQLQIRNHTSLLEEQGNSIQGAASFSSTIDASSIPTQKEKNDENITSNFTTELKEFETSISTLDFIENITAFYGAAVINSSTDGASVQTSTEVEDMKEGNDTSLLVEYGDSSEDPASSSSPTDFSSIQTPNVKEVENDTSNFSVLLKDFKTRKDISDLFEPVTVFYRAAVINSSIDIASLQESTELEPSALNSSSTNTTGLNEFPVLERKIVNSTFMQEVDTSPSTIDLSTNFTPSETQISISTVRDNENNNTNSIENTSTLIEFSTISAFTKSEDKSYHLTNFDAPDDVSSMELIREKFTTREVQGEFIGFPINNTGLSEFSVAGYESEIKEFEDGTYHPAKIDFPCESCSTEIPIQIFSTMKDEVIIVSNHTSGMSEFIDMNNKSAVKKLEDETYLPEKTDISTDESSTEIRTQNLSAREEQREFVRYSASTTSLSEFSGMNNNSALTTDLNKLEDTKATNDAIDVYHPSANINSVKDSFSTEAEQTEFQVSKDIPFFVEKGDSPPSAVSVSSPTNVSWMDTPEVKIEEYIISNYSFGLEDFEAREVSSNFFEPVSVFYRAAIINSVTGIVSMPTLTEGEQNKSTNFPMNTMELAGVSVMKLENENFTSMEHVAMPHNTVNVNLTTGFNSLQRPIENSSVKEKQIETTYYSASSIDFSPMSSNFTFAETSDKSYSLNNVDSHTNVSSIEVTMHNLTTGQPQGEFIGSATNIATVSELPGVSNKPPIEEHEDGIYRSAKTDLSDNLDSREISVQNSSTSEEQSEFMRNSTWLSEVSGMNNNSASTTELSELEDLTSISELINVSRYFTSIYSVTDFFSEENDLKAFKVENETSFPEVANSSQEAPSNSAPTTDFSSIPMTSMKKDENGISNYSTGLKDIKTRKGTSDFTELVNVFYSAAIINSSMGISSVQKSTETEAVELTSPPMNTTSPNKLPVMELKRDNSTFTEQENAFHNIISNNSSVGFTPTQTLIANSSGEKQGEITNSSENRTELSEFPAMKTAFEEIGDESYHFTNTVSSTGVPSIELNIQSLTTRDAQGEFMASSTNNIGLNGFSILSSEALTKESEDVTYRSANIDLVTDMASKEISIQNLLTRVKQSKFTGYFNNTIWTSEFPGTNTDSTLTEPETVFFRKENEDLPTEEFSTVGNSSPKEIQSEFLGPSTNITKLIEFLAMNYKSADKQPEKLSNQSENINSFTDVALRRTSASEVDYESMGFAPNTTEISEFLVKNYKSAVAKSDAISNSSENINSLTVTDVDVSKSIDIIKKWIHFLELQNRIRDTTLTEENRYSDSATSATDFSKGSSTIWTLPTKNLVKHKVSLTAEYLMPEWSSNEMGEKKPIFTEISDLTMNVTNGAELNENKTLKSVTKVSNSLKFTENGSLNGIVEENSAPKVNISSFTKLSIRTEPNQEATSLLLTDVPYSTMLVRNIGYRMANVHSNADFYEENDELNTNLPASLPRQSSRPLLNGTYVNKLIENGTLRYRDGKLRGSSSFDYSTKDIVSLSKSTSKADEVNGTNYEDTSGLGNNTPSSQRTGTVDMNGTNYEDTSGFGNTTPSSQRTGTVDMNGTNYEDISGLSNTTPSSQRTGTVDMNDYHNTSNTISFMNITKTVSLLGVGTINLPLSESFMDVSYSVGITDNATLSTYEEVSVSTLLESSLIEIKSIENLTSVVEGTDYTTHVNLTPFVDASKKGTLEEKISDSMVEELTNGAVEELSNGAVEELSNGTVEELTNGTLENVSGVQPHTDSSTRLVYKNTQQSESSNGDSAKDNLGFQKGNITSPGARNVGPWKRFNLVFNNTMAARSHSKALCAFRHRGCRKVLLDKCFQLLQTASDGKSRIPTYREVIRLHRGLEANHLKVDEDTRKCFSRIVRRCPRRRYDCMVKEFYEESSVAQESTISQQSQEDRKTGTLFWYLKKLTDESTVTGRTAK